MTSDNTTRFLVPGMIAAAIERLAPKKSQRELAREMGFVRPNMLSMIRTGAAQVPFGRIPDIAAVLGIDPAQLLKAWVMEDRPEFEMVFDEIFGGILTQRERDWIRFFEDVGMVEPPRNLQMRQKLLELLQREEWTETEEEEES